MIKTFNILLDLENKSKNLPFSVSQNDLNTIRINMTIIKDGIAIPIAGITSARIAIKKPGPNGLSVFQDCEIVDPSKGKISVTLSAQAYTELGEHKAELYLYEGDTVSVTSTFSYTSRKAILDNGTVTSTNDWQSINNALIQIDSGLNRIENADVYTKNEADVKLTGKVDIVAGKGLSTNDYDNTEKAEVAKVKDKADKTYVDNGLLTKVDKVTGKGLSTNDYDNTEKAEVAKIKDKVNQTDVGNLANLTTTDKTNLVNAINSNVAQLADNATQISDIAINVKSLGAKTDGTDATAFFTQARAKSKYIFVPEGTFIVDNLSLQDAVLIGNGTLKWKNSSTSPFMLELKGRCLVEGITFDGNASNQTTNSDAVRLTTADKTTIRNNIFTNFRYKVINSDVANSSNVQILNNRFENCGTVSNCDVITVRSSDWLINGNYFSNIGDGHSVRMGLLTGDPTVNPVERTIISNNHFKDTQHNGVTCEIYTRDTIISGNTFDNLPQAIKMEISGATVYDITISNNVIRNINLSTALNLVGTKVKFTNNRCYNLAGGPIFSEYFDCSHNEFYDCGTASLYEVITTNGNPLHGVVSNNLIVNPKYRAIVLVGGTITGNRIINCADQAIRVTDSAVITDNYINGATNGVVLVSTANNSVVNNNVFLNVSSSAIAFTNNTAFNTVFIKENVGAALSDLTYTLASDSITISYSARTIRVGGEGATADNLATINGGFIGQMIFLRAVSTSQPITVQDKVGNIDLIGSSFIINSGNDILTLIWNGSYWCEVARSDNG